MLKNNTQKRLVLVDDEEMVIASIKNFLMLETDYEVLSFTSPSKAIEALRETPINLAISDFFMPEMDGIEFLKNVHKLYSQATLILLTGYADKENAIKAINELGIYKYIEKPWDNEDLKITIDNAFERTDLILNLENKVDQLNKAQNELQIYNDQLEHLVQERTRELRYANAELKAIIESSPDGILTLNDNLIITSSNPAFNLLRGDLQNNIVNQHITKIINISEIKNLEPSKIRQPYLHNICSIYNTRLSKFIPAELSIAPILTEIPSSEPNYVAIVRDLTAQKETERLREDFIATLTHDLRTPLQAAIQTLSFFIDRTLGDLNDKQEKYLETMKTSNQDMLGLVNSLLEVYKMESQGIRLIQSDVDVKEIVKACLNEVKSLLEKKNLSLEADITQNKLEAYADRKEIRRVLANFIGNAINYTPVNGKITVNALTSESNITVTVSDTGRGIPQADLEKLFQRFSQGTSKQRSTGTGLGLYLSRQIIEAHKGKVWATSEINKGSTFGFSIPTKQIEDKNE